MNCLTSRRLLLSAPRERTDAQREHIAGCTACSRLVDELAALESRLEDAASVPAPDALAERVLLTHRGRRAWRFAIAAGIVAVIGAAAAALPSLADFAATRNTTRVVGPTHPAVAAIALAMEERAELPQSGNEVEMTQELQRFGLKLKQPVYAYYVGKCSLSGSDCDLIAVSTQDASAKLILLSDYPANERVLVADRKMTALMEPVKTGAYIVVADTPAQARRIAKFIGQS